MHILESCPFCGYQGVEILVDAKRVFVLSVFCTVPKNAGLLQREGAQK